MPGVATLTLDQLQQQLLGFDETYVDDWNCWLIDRSPENFLAILRKWQAGRPNSMRNVVRAEQLVAQAEPYLAGLTDFDLRDAGDIDAAGDNLGALWDIFQHLTDPGGRPVRGGLAGIVGISKAVLLLTEGRVGPAFDREVRTNLGLRQQGLRDIASGITWQAALRVAQQDLAQFEINNGGITLREAAQRVVPQFATIPTGRLYDMALGPRG